MERTVGVDATEKTRLQENMSLAFVHAVCQHTVMTVEQVKREAATLSFVEQGELAAYLVQLRNRQDPEYLPEMHRRIQDTNRKHWLTPDEFEKRLGAK